MSKTPQERFDEIQKEIWKISESFMIATKNKSISDLTGFDMRHLEILHYRLGILVVEMKTLSHEVKISLIYKKLVNKLMYDLGCCVSQEYANELREAMGSVDILF